MKKVFKIFSILLFVIIAILIAIPFFLESKIETIVKNYADENLNADMHFDAISLSLIRSFPEAQVRVENLNITNKAPFESETFVSAKSLAFDMPLTQLFQGTDTPLTVTEIIANELLLTLKTNKNGVVNYDITKTKDQTTSAPEEATSNPSFSFDIEHYELNNSSFTYIDEGSNTNFYLTEINHSGNGLFSGEVSELETTTDAMVSMAIDSTSYLNNIAIKLEALIDLDLTNSKYTFKDNKAFINALPLEFNGFVQLLDTEQHIDISFTNPNASFKDFLAVIPETYAKNIEDVSTSGNFTLKGVVKGVISDNTIPTLDINMQSRNAAFKYPNLPKGIDDIVIDASVKNTTGNIDDTYIDINTLDFKIDKDVFTSEAHLKDLTSNMKVNASMDGVLNLDNITKAYPVELDNALSGIIKGTLNTTFDMQAIENNAYERIKNNGKIAITDFVFSSEDIVNPIQINTAEITFNPSTVHLNAFDAQTGKSDFSATGRITNLIGFLLKSNTLQGNFNVNSNVFAISDFMVEDTSVTETSNKTTTDTESLKIPEFLDCTISANAKTVYYDNLELKNVKGQLVIKDQTAQLSNVTTDVFNGKLGLTGHVSTKTKQPTFNMQLGMQQFDISQSFKDLELLQSLAPIAKVVQGKLNSTIDINGMLDADFSPDLNTISGNALANILTTKVNTEQSPLLSGLGSQLNFIDFENIEKDISTTLSFENGQVSVKPFTITYEDIPIEVSGTHSFSNTMNYSAVLQVPAKYLGSDVNRLIGQINDNEVNSMSVPVTASIGGTFSNPSVKTDLSTSVSHLTKQLVDIQKQKLIGKGTKKVNDLLGGLLGGGKTDINDAKSEATDNTKQKSTPENTITKGVKNVLGGLLGKRKKAKDSTKN